MLSTVELFPASCPGGPYCVDTNTCYKKSVVFFSAFSIPSLCYDSNNQRVRWRGVAASQIFGDFVGVMWTMNQ